MFLSKRTLKYFSILSQIFLPGRSLLATRQPMTQISAGADQWAGGVTAPGWRGPITGRHRFIPNHSWSPELWCPRPSLGSHPTPHPRPRSRWTRLALMRNHSYRISTMIRDQNQNWDESKDWDVLTVSKYCMYEKAGIECWTEDNKLNQKIGNLTFC